MPIENISDEKLKSLFLKMLKTRLVSEKIIELYPEQEMRCPVHLSVGQEAVAAGVCEELNSFDAVFSHHRCHSHYLSMGGSIKEMFAELYAKTTGCCRGVGGSMHLSAPEKGFMAASSIVGGTMPVAVGAALAFKMNQEKRVAVAFFGDGGVDEGIFHESLNFAALRGLPIIFVCENNFYAVLSPLVARQKNTEIFTKAASYNLPGVVVDGNDAVAVFKVAKEAIDRARVGGGPTLIEARTYRWHEHVGPYCDHEAGHRPACEVEEWMKKCPVKNFEELLIHNKILLIAEKEEIISNLKAEIEAGVQFAKESPYPFKEDLLKFVYSAQI